MKNIKVYPYTLLYYGYYDFFFKNSKKFISDEQKYHFILFFV